MTWLVHHPLILCVCSFLILWLSARAGIWLQRWGRLDEETRGDFGVVQAATLTFLGLIIGFTFSLATSRYDQRKLYEEEEANAIGTEFVRLDLLPGDTTKLRSLLRQYLDARIQYYQVRDPRKLAEISSTTARLQSDLWANVTSPAKAQPSPMTALAVAGMNDVLNSQGYTQAAWLNRIPTAAWALMFVTAIFCNAMLGFGIQRANKEKGLLIVLPLVVSIAFLLISDIDSPRWGIILVRPLNLISLSQSLPQV